MTHICVSKLTIIGSDNGLSPGRRQAIIWNNTGLLLIEPLGTNFSEISIGIQRFSFKKMHLNMSAAIWRPFCLGLNVLMGINSLASGRSLIFTLIIQNNSFSTCCENAPRWMPQNLINEKSTLVKVIPCHYLSQCWSRFMLSYDDTFSLICAK